MIFQKSNLIAAAASAFLIALGCPQAALACKPCSKLNQLAKDAVKATPEQATKIIGQSNEIFQEVTQAQPKLDPATAYDMLSVAIHLMDEDKGFNVIDNLQEAYDGPKNKATFEQQLKRFRPKEIETFKKRLKSVREQGASEL